MNIERDIELLSWGAETIITPGELREKLALDRPLAVKLGVDPTAPDIHLGHTVVLRKLRQFQDLGHEAVLIIGGFTSRIGDPSGKSKTRPPLSAERIEENARTYLDQVEKILLGERLRVVDNRKWLDPMTLKDMLGLLSHATMSKLLEHNTFKDRFRQSDSIRMHEFIYPFLQAYDSIHLHADIELGGTDQLFNIAFGRELQKEYGQYPQAALLMPILSGTDGVRKMSKSLDNYIGVLEAPKTMEQKLLNMPDANIVDYLKLLTPLPPEEVREIEKSLSGSPSTRTILECKHRLIDEILAIYHPQTDRNRTEVLSIPKDECKEDGLPVLKALHLAGFAKSNREAFGFLKSGAVKVDGEKITDRNISLHLEKGPVDLALGKKKRVRIELDSR